MWQVVKPLDATSGVRPQKPVLDLEVRGAGLSERERPEELEPSASTHAVPCS